MFAITTRHILRISKPSLPATFARMSTTAFLRVRARLNDDNDDYQHDYDHDHPSIKQQKDDPLNLDIVSSPEVRKILAQQRGSTDSPNKMLPRLEQPFFRPKHTSFFPFDDGYDSDFEPMHTNWENEKDFD